MIGQRVVTFACCLAVMAVAAPAAEMVYPVKDGTIVDGDIFGIFDGVGDDADWFFNQSSYEGAISRTTGMPQSSLEHRVVWEYDLSGMTPPVSATLHIKLRGAPAFPRTVASVHVYAYAADLQETMSDFSTPATDFLGVLTVPPYQPPTTHTVDVSDYVDAMLTAGTYQVAFRLQIDPQTVNPAAQVFIDTIDVDVTTKPFLLIEDTPPVPGDVDGDGDVDLDDYAGMVDCLEGPNRPVISACLVYDFDADTDVDLDDVRLFQSYFSPNVTGP